MRNRLFTTIIFTVSLMLAACDGSMHPLSDPADSEIDVNLVGTWHFTSKDDPADDDELYLSILPFNDHEYVTVGWSPGDEDDASLMGLFTTEINGDSFATVKCLVCDEDDGLYFLFKYELTSRSELIVYAIEDDEYDQLRLLDSTEDVHRYVTENLNRPGFFDEPWSNFQKEDDLIWPW